MKPCRKNRETIVWLASGTLESGQASALRDHLARCEGCRGYWEEITSVTRELAAAEPESRIQTSEIFHRRVVAGLRTVTSASLLGNRLPGLRPTFLNWHVALPAIAVLMVIGVIIVARRPEVEVAASAPKDIPAVSGLALDPALAPTIANYQRVANQSLARLDALLTRQGGQTLSPLPVYTASTRPDANGLF